MWYVIQTEAGKEQELVDMINKVVEHRVFTRCFFVKRERVRRIKGECAVYTEALYPGYVFIDTADPEGFYSKVRELPQFTRFLGNDEGLHAVDADEKEFLSELMDSDAEDTIRLSPVRVNDEGEIVECGGAAGKFWGNVIRKRIRDRYVVVRAKTGGKEREILLGVRKVEKIE